MIQTWGIGPSVVGPSWSLSVELAAYVLFPLLVTLVLRSTRTFASATVAAGYLLLALAVLYTSGSLAKDVGSLDVTSPYSGFPILRCLVQFCGGLLAYRISITPRIKGVLARPAMSYLAVGIALGLIAFPGTDIFVAATFPWIVAGLAVSRHGVSALLSTTGPFFLGEISYSLYMLHIQFLRMRRLGYRFWTTSWTLRCRAAGLDSRVNGPFVTAHWTYLHVEIEPAVRSRIWQVVARALRLKEVRTLVRWTYCDSCTC
jgi:peptidoglycan/LPS O-acetylase OafA/YrhL